ncbi:MAG: prepilin-type N-terminal cleavage/methylation domain-containing protein [Clostridiales bacterium]|nr:prepilin-type N-terminal cleavage/methylation domain-containing protein [Clostridiales bacterium]
MRKICKQSRKGFTLLELIIVVAIIVIVTAIAIIVFGGALKSAKDFTDSLM